MWDYEFLQRNVREEIRRLANLNYIVFQISRGMAGDVETLKKIERYIETLSCKVWLLPIGKVNSHGDLSILERIYLNNKEKCIYVNDIGLYDTTYIISRSKGFIGSSLHGNLISFSYGIPSILISNKNTKNRDYYDTWLSDSSCIVYTLAELLDRDLEFKDGDSELLSSHKKKIYENFERMASYIYSNI